ncbi:MAG: Rib/alpha-like domain-containing protein [Erysipelotrichaceae bacterium]|jgi:Rib/alpha/Esp surface antigen-like repeat protein
MKNLNFKISKNIVYKIWIIMLTVMMVFSGLSVRINAQDSSYETGFEWDNGEEVLNEWPLDPNLTKTYTGVGTVGFSYNRYYYNDLGQIVLEFDFSVFPDDIVIDFGTAFRTFREQWDYANIFIDPQLVTMVDDNASFFMMSYPVEIFPATPTAVSLGTAVKTGNIYKLNINQVFPVLSSTSDYMKSKLYLVLQSQYKIGDLTEDYAVQLRYTNINNQVYEQRGTKGNQVIGSYFGHVENYPNYDASFNNDDVTLKTIVPFKTASMSNIIPNPVLPPDMMRTVAQSVVYDNINGTLSIYYRVAPNHYIYTGQYANNGYFLSSWIGIRQVMDSRIYDALKPDENGVVGYMKMFDLNGTGKGWNVTTEIKSDEFNYTAVTENVGTYSYMLVPTGFKTAIEKKAFVANNQKNNVKNVYLHGHKKEADFVRFIYNVDKNKMDALFSEVNSSSLSISTSYITDRPTETNQTEYRLTVSQDIVIDKGALIVFDLPRGSRSVFKAGLANNYERIIGDMTTKRSTDVMNNYGVDPGDFGKAYTQTPYFATSGGHILTVEAGLTIKAGEIISLTMFDSSSPASVKITVVNGAERTDYTLSKYLVNENGIYNMPNANVRSGVVINRSANTPHVDEFFTNSTIITGHSKYPDALVSIRKAADDVVFKEAYSSSTAELFKAEGNPENKTGYKFTLDIPVTVTIKKDMPLSFSNAASGYFRSSGSTYRAQAKVIFDKNNGTFETVEKIVPMNKKAYGTAGYVANGFEGDNILWLDANGFDAEATTEEKFFSDYEGKPIKVPAETDKRKYYDVTIDGLPQREGYTFLGWSTVKVDSMSLESYNNMAELTELSQWNDGMNYKFTSYSPVDESKTVYAVWQKNIDTYRIVLHDNNDENDVIYTIDVPAGNITGGKTSELTAYLNTAGNILYDAGFRKDGCYFVGWAEIAAVPAETQVHDLYTNASKIQLVEAGFQLQLNEQPEDPVSHENIWKTVDTQFVNDNGVATLHLYAQYRPLLTMSANKRWYGPGEKEKYESDPEGYEENPLAVAPFANSDVAMVLLRTTEGKTLDPTKYEILPGFYVAGKDGEVWQWAPQEGHDINGRKYYYLLTEFNGPPEGHTIEEIIEHFYNKRTWASLYITMIGQSDLLSKYTAISFVDEDNNTKSYMAVATSNQPDVMQLVNPPSGEETGYEFLLRNFEVDILPPIINRVQENHQQIVIDSPTDGASYLYLILDDSAEPYVTYLFAKNGNEWQTNETDVKIQKGEGEYEGKLIITSSDPLTPLNFEGRANERVYALFTVLNEQQDISKYASRAIQPYGPLENLEEVKQEPHIKNDEGNITHNVISARIPAGSYAGADYTLGYLNDSSEFVPVLLEGNKITVKPDIAGKLTFNVPDGILSETVNYIIQGVDPADTYKVTDFNGSLLDLSAPIINAENFDLLTGEMIAEDAGKIVVTDSSATSISYMVTKNDAEVNLPEGIVFDPVAKKFYGRTADILDESLKGEYLITIKAEDIYGNVSTGYMTINIIQKPKTAAIESITQNYNDNDGNASIVVKGIKDARIKFYSKNEDGTFTEIVIDGLSGNQIDNEDGTLAFSMSQTDVKRFAGLKVYITQMEDKKLESDLTDYVEENIDVPGNKKSVTGGAIVIDNIPPTPLQFIQPLAGTSLLKITNISADEEFSDIDDIDRIVIKIGDKEPCTLDRQYDVSGKPTGKWLCNFGFEFDEVEEEITVIVDPNTGATETRTVEVLNFILPENGVFEEFQNIIARYYDYLGNVSAEVTSSVPKLPEPVAPYDMTAVNDSTKHPTETVIKGKADSGAIVSVTIEATTYSAEVDELGNFTLEIPRQETGTEISVTSKLNNYTNAAAVDVTDVEADIYYVTVKDIRKTYGQPTTAQEIFRAVKIIGYPKGDEHPFLTLQPETKLPDGRVSGEYQIPVIINYPDGSAKTVYVKVTVGPQPQNRKYHPEVENEIVIVGGTFDLTDNVINIRRLPAGTTVKDTTLTEIDTSVVGTYPGQITVTYPDGSKDVVSVLVIVQAEPLSDRDKYTATGGIVDKNEGESVTEEEIIAAVEITPDLQDGVSVNISLLSPLPTTGMNNKVNLLVTYSDGSTDTVTVIVNFHAPEIPQSKERSWSLVSLIMTLFSAIAMAAQLLAKSVKNDDGTGFVRNRIYRITTSVFAVVAAVYFVVTNNMSLPMQLVNETTLISSIMAIVTMASLGFGLRWKEDE